MSLISLPVGPQSVRVFCGYRLPALNREAFLKELGDTFMPGTPYMLAPLGLGAYVAAVLDLDPAAGMPDEVALIVYASEPVYREARNNSLQGRMYTHSHAGVFDMVRSRGQFPGAASAPSVLTPGDRWSWFLFDRPVDWQQGFTRLIFLQGSPPGGQLQPTLRDATLAAQGALAGAGVDEVIVVAGADFAAVWLHGPAPLTLNPADAGLVPEGVQVALNLVATPVPMRRGDEGVAIASASAFCFRFVRDLRFFI